MLTVYCALSHNGAYSKMPVPRLMGTETNEQHSHWLYDNYDNERSLKKTTKLLGILSLALHENLVSPYFKKREAEVC